MDTRGDAMAGGTTVAEGTAAAEATPARGTTVADPGPGAHLVSLYADEAEHLAAVVPFLLGGLRANERVVCVTTPGTAEAIGDRLRAAGMDPAPFQASGRLSLVGIPPASPEAPPPDPERMLLDLRSDGESAAAAGYEGQRVAVQAAAVLPESIDSDHLVRLEFALDDLLADHLGIALCLYDRRRFAPGLLLDVVRTHPRVVVGADVCGNPHYLPPGAMRGADREATELDFWLDGLAERKAADDALRAARLRLERTIEGTGAGTWETNLQTGEALVSERWAGLVGYTLDELAAIGPDPYRQLAHPDDLARADGLLARHLSGELPDYRHELRMRHRDGHWVWIESRGRLLARTDDGRPLLMYGIHTDISDRRRAEEALAAAHGRLRRFFDANLLGIAISAADGSVVDANDYYLGVLGYSREELGRGEVDWRAITPPEWLPADEAALREIAERGSCAAFEKEYLRRDGSRVPVLIAGAAIGGAGGELATFVLDIGKRKATEEALRRSEERYRQLFDSASDAVFVIERETFRIVDANDMASTLYGYGRDEMLGLTSPDLSAEPARTAQFIRQVRADPGQVPIVDERLHRKKDGTVFPVEFSARTVDRDGAPMLLIACRDITERKAAQEAIRQMALMLDTAPNAISVTDLEGRFLYVNARNLALHGYEADEYQAFDLARVTAPAFVAGIGDRLAEVLRTGEAEYEVDHLRKDGSILPLAVTARRTTWGGADAILRISRDITERRAAERALLESKAELEEAQRVAHVGSWTRDLATGSGTWSDELFRIFALEPGGPVPSIEEQEALHAPGASARISVELARTARTGAGYEVQYDIVRPDGATRHLVERGEAADATDGVVTHLRGTVVDVTELREAQARVDRASRAEMVGRLAGGIAHEFNNLLTTIGGYASLVSSSLPASDPLQADLDEIQRATDRAGSLTHQLLAFGRRELLRPTAVDPGDVVDGLVPVVRGLVPEGVRLVVRRDDEGGIVAADRDHLEDAIVGLVLNARDAMPGGGTLTVETAAETVAPADPRLRAPAEPGDYVRVTVGDTGTGIAADLLPHIFEPFFSTKDAGPGTGLGLAGIEGFAAMSGGFIAVRTAPGAGSWFSLFLPRSAQAPARARGREAADREAASANLPLPWQD